MDLRKVLEELREERDRIDRLIANLETLSAIKKTGSAEQKVIGRALQQRGRPTVGPEERIAISRRMKEYWARRRKTA